MKKWFIGMSINKQLYFGIFGISFLFGLFCLLLILLASSKLFFTYNLNLKAVFNDIDTKIVVLNGENSDLFAQLVFYQGKFEALLLRNYFDLLSYDFGNEIVNMFNIDIDEINKHFKFHQDSSDLCDEENSKCFFVFSETNNINNITKKILYFLIPIIEVSLNIQAYNKDKFEIFNKFNFFENENKAYISYKYNKEYIQKNFDIYFTPTELMNNTFFSFIKEIPTIEELNDLKINDLTNQYFFKDNIFSVFPSFKPFKIIDPFNKFGGETFHFCSFLFDEEEVNDNDKVDINKTNIENLKNFISFNMNINSLSFFSLNFIQRNGAVFIYILGSNFKYTISKTACRLSNFNNFIYSDESIKNSLNFSIKYLGLNESQLNYVDECFQKEKMIEIITSDNFDYKLKILTNLYNYSYYRDINNFIRVKILRYYSPDKFIKSLVNVNFFSTYQVYFIVIKMYNNVMVIEQVVDRLTFKAICQISLISFLLWIIIYIFTFIKLYLVADRISSPIRKLIKNISLSQGNFNNNALIMERIYYKEDKDINDLFQICQKLIFGGFKKKNYIQKYNKLNVYNNVSIIKTNNMIINEDSITVQRNEKYNEIFERGNELIKKVDTFKDNIYHKYKDTDFDIKIKNLESIKIKRIPLDKKEELETLKNKDNEYKMFYYINNEIEGILPFNNLYKCYYDEFSKKSNKKKKK